MEKYQLGTHLVATRTIYTHHGIYVGNNEVIHYGGLADELKKDRICKVSLQKFQGTGTIKEYKYEELLHGERYHGAETVKRAYSRLSENKYNVSWNNCETFANWCTHGDEYSSQTDGTVNRRFTKEMPIYAAVLPPLNIRETFNKVARIFSRL